MTGGMSCDWLRLWNNDTDFSKLVKLVSDLPEIIRPALVSKKSYTQTNTHRIYAYIYIMYKYN
jgi:hypothetical protein